MLYVFRDRKNVINSIIHIIMKQMSFSRKCLSLVLLKTFSLFDTFSDWTTTLGVVVFVITDTLDDVKESFSVSAFKTVVVFLFSAHLLFHLLLEFVTIKNP